MFDPFAFVERRVAGMRVSDDEAAEFNSYLGLQALSMDPGLTEDVIRLNTEEFTKLPPELQAKICNGFNCRVKDTKWHRAKSAAIAEREEFLEKAMKVYGISHSSAEECLLNGLLDVAYVNEKYAFQYAGKSPRWKKTESETKETDVSKYV